MSRRADPVRHPFRFEVRGRRFSSYTVMLYVGLAVAIAVAEHVARRAELDARGVVIASVVLIPICLAGARGLAVLLAWKHFRARPREIARMDRGGAAMYGALPPALLASVPLLRALGIPFGAFWDVAAVAILAGSIPTRLGCLTNGCCAGRRMPGLPGLLLPGGDGSWERRFPIPLAEAVLAGALLALCAWVWDARPFPGAAFLLVLAGYGAGRLALDALRERRGPTRLGLGACQWISLGLVAVAALGLAAGPALDGAEGTRMSPDVAAAGPPSALLLAAGGLLLLPVVHLFRFLGCDLVFGLDSPPAVPTQVLQLAAIVPATGPAVELTARIALIAEPSMDEIEGSPFDLPPKAPLSDGSLVFETLVEVPEGAYVASCRVESPTVASRIGTCSGSLDAPGLAVIFFANAATLPNVINPIVCFEPPPS